MTTISAPHTFPTRYPNSRFPLTCALLEAASIDPRDAAITGLTATSYQSTSPHAIGTVSPASSDTRPTTTVAWATKELGAAVLAQFQAEGGILPAPTKANPLNAPIEQDDTKAATIGAYLAKILNALLDEGEGFSAKRPLGNSDWDGNIDEALTQASLDLHDLTEAVTKALAVSA